MKDWFLGLQPKERLLCVVGGFLVFIVLIWLLLLLPFSNKVNALETSVSNKKKELLWMNRVDNEIRELKRGQTSQPANTKISLINAVETSSTRGGFRDAVKRISPQSNKSLSVELADVDFDNFIQWIGQLQQRYAILTTQITVNESKETGKINAKLILSRADQV